MAVMGKGLALPQQAALILAAEVAAAATLRLKRELLEGRVS